MRFLLIVTALCMASPTAAADEIAEIADCGLEDPLTAVAPVPRKPRASVAIEADADSAVRRVRPDRHKYGTVGHGAVGGALAGKTVYVSAGHGWTWHETNLVWFTQRGNTHNLVEDLISTETASYYLIKYLHNMGAYVVPVRESDPNPNRVEVDDGGSGFSVEGQLDMVSGPTGFGPLGYPITDLTNPFLSGGSTDLTASETETGQAVWTFDVPEDGAYNVYVSYVQDPTRASDAHYIVRHAGGEAHFRVDQRRHGGTWVLLGKFYFEAGTSPFYGAVALANDSQQAGATLSADAARIGGGAGLFDRGGGTSGRPMFEHCSYYNAQLNGAPPEVYRNASTDRSSDVSARSRFAAWDQADGEDAVYIAWHTNAPDPGRGTSSFVYGPNFSDPDTSFEGAPGSRELQDAIHGELVGDIRAAWDPAWRDRGQFTAYFGEVNPNHNPDMPAVLTEIAFHDTAADASSLRDPRFRRLAARALAQGVARYFAVRDGDSLTLPPEPPSAARVVQDGQSLQVAWRPPVEDPAGGDPPTGYRVYLSSDGKAFDDGHDVTGESWSIPTPPHDAAIYARVTAVNDGGESLPSPVVGARVSASDRAQVLIVGGFERLDRSMLIAENLSAFGLGTVDRGLIERMNDETHIARHGDAISAAEVSFDSATAEAITRGDVDLSAYAAVDWFLGEETSCCDPLNTQERDALARYLAGGGRLVISGSELGWALDALGSPEDQAYFRETFHAAYVADDSDTYSAVGLGGPLAGIGEFSFGDRGPGGFDADYPDILDPLDGAIGALSYQGGAGGIAATWYTDDATGERQLIMGFPFETIEGADTRATVMAAILAGFDIEPDPAPPGSTDDWGADVAIDDDDATAGCGCKVGRDAPDGGTGLLVLAVIGLLAGFRRQRLGSAAGSAISSIKDQGNNHESLPGVYGQRNTLLHMHVHNESMDSGPHRMW